MAVLNLLTFLSLLFACSQVQASHRCFGREGEIRLADGPNSREGRVDICVGIYWYTPCQDTWGIEETQVVCRELQFCQQGGNFTSGQSYQGYIPYLLNEINCSGNKTVLSSCNRTYPSSNCYNHIGAGVSCAAQTPNAPENVQITVINSYTIQVSWSQPDVGNCTDVEQYRIDCFEYYWCYDSSDGQTNASTGVIMLQDFSLFQYCEYTCCVHGTNSAGTGPQSCVQQSFPSPMNVTSISSPTSLLIQWFQPEYGIHAIDHHIVTCGTQSRYLFHYGQTTAELFDLSPFTTYECCISVHYYWYTYQTKSTCINTTTSAVPPNSPLNISVPEATPISVQLEWSRPQPVHGIISHYTTTCYPSTQGVAVSISINSAVNQTTVQPLQPSTNYTCCVSATNQAGEGNQTCVGLRTLQPAPPTQPEGVAMVSTSTTSLALSWNEPAESYGQTILYYTINCTSTNNSVGIERVYYTNISIEGLMADTNYTCCVVATSSVGLGSQECIIVMTKKEHQQTANNEFPLTAAISAGVVVALTAVLLVVIISLAVCCCYNKRKNKHQQSKQSKAPAEVVYKAPGDSNGGHNDTHSIRANRYEYKEDVEIRYEKPVLRTVTGATTQANTRENINNSDTSSLTSNQQNADNKVYQPLVPPKTYKATPEDSAYQDLSFETREQVKEGDSEGQSLYEPVERSDEQNVYEPIGQGEGVSQYQPLTFGDKRVQEESNYQPLTRGEEENQYETFTQM